MIICKFTLIQAAIAVTEHQAVFEPPLTWESTSSTGIARYAAALPQPIGGWPSTSGNSHDMPAPWGGGEGGGGGGEGHEPS